MVLACCSMKDGMFATPQSCKHRSYSSALFSQMPLPHEGAAGAQVKVKVPVVLSTVRNSSIAEPLVDAIGGASRQVKCASIVSRFVVWSYTSR